MIKSKKALELSINFIVIVILSMIVFGMGIYLINLFFKQAETIKESLDQQTERQIEALLDSGHRVAIPIDNKVIQNGKSEVFGLGILNILDATETFTIKLHSSLYIGPDKNAQSPPPIPLEFIEEYDREIKNNEQVVIPLPIRVPRKAPSGTYVINVEIDPYQEVHQITVRVP